MPTYQVGPGHPYATIAAALAVANRTVADAIVEVDEDPVGYTEQLTINTAVSATRRLILRAFPNTRPLIIGGIRVDVGYVDVENLELTGGRAAFGGGKAGIEVEAGAVSGDVNLRRNLIHDVSDGAGGYGVRARQNGATVFVDACEVYGANTNGIRGQETSGTTTIRNCTVDALGGDYGVRTVTAATSVYNTAAFRATTADFDGTFAANTNNASADATAPGAASITGIRQGQQFMAPDGSPVSYKLNPRTAQVLYQAGSAANQASVDYDSHSWNGGTPSIGAQQYQSPILEWVQPPYFPLPGMPALGAAVLVQYRLIDVESNPVTMAMRFRRAVPIDAPEAAATQGVGGDGLAALASSPYPGTLHTFSWNTTADMAGEPPGNYYLVADPTAEPFSEPQDSPPFFVDNDDPPFVTAVTPSNPTTTETTATVPYTLHDPDSSYCSIAVEFSLTGLGGPWLPAAPAVGVGDPTTGLATSPAGIPYVFGWDVSAIADGLYATAAIRIQPTDVNGLQGPWVPSAVFTLDTRDHDPHASNATAAGSPFAGPHVTVNYTLSDFDSDLVDITPEWSYDGAEWFPCTPGPGGDGVTALTTSPAGTSHTFVWNALADNVRRRWVRVRITPVP